MKFLAIEKESSGVAVGPSGPLLRPEAKRVWELYQSGVIRETYFRADRDEAVLLLECGDMEEAARVIATLPLVQSGHIAFDVIPLIPYPGFARLFER